MSRVLDSWRKLFHRAHKDAELSEEMNSFLAEETAENEARGLSPDEARRQAHLKLGSPRRVREDVWQQNSFAFLDGLWRDVRYAVRTLSRSLGFTLMAVFVVALGIGANVALFTVVRSVLINPLPYRDPGKLYTIYQRGPKAAASPDKEHFMPVDAGSAQEWRENVGSAADLALICPWRQYNVSGQSGQMPEQVDAAWVSANFFPTLGVQPILGRPFTESDDSPSANATVILSNGFWKRRYASDPGIIGRQIILDARPYTVVGVLPASFVYAGSLTGNTNQVWVPVMHEIPQELLHIYNDHEFVVIARLHQGVTLNALLDQLGALQAQIKIRHPQGGVHEGASGRSMLDDSVQDYRKSLYVLLGATCCVLLIACLNVASLLVARQAAREREHAIRAALGGSALRLLRERLTESLMISLSGGILGLGLAWLAVAWFTGARQDMNRIEAVHIDGMVFALAAGLILLCALFSGLVSAWSGRSRAIMGVLQQASRSQNSGGAKAGLRRILLVLEVGLTVVLLTGAGLLLKSYQHLLKVDLGVPIANTLTLGISLPDGRYKAALQQVQFFEQLIERVRSVPGVSAAGLVTAAPGQGWGADRMMSVVEHPPLAKGEGYDIMARGADPGYFAAIGLPLIRGRLFTADERLTRDHVVLISERTAKLLFPGEDPIGRHLRSELGGDIYEVVGVVGDTRYEVSIPMQATLYWPIYGNESSAATIVVKSSTDVNTLAMPIQRLVASMDPDLPVANVMTLQETIARSTVASQFSSVLIVAFALIALLLSAAGLYGVLAYLVTQRTSEIGIRIALGAQREKVLRQMLLDGLRPALLGLALGLAGSVAVVRQIQSMLYETEPLDPAVFAVVAVTLLLVAGFACLIPAWRASRLDPMRALRSE
ncbi:ABC transporter permease [Acidicapsa ligni]|uniref:ABC transporter permease n=1 Tax=Acidicapsa ligni TaxID=542300 RepID=UPI0021E018FD|nr:ABC transporter permease [Acidicapsa ligni]